MTMPKREVAKMAMKASAIKPTMRKKIAEVENILTSRHVRHLERETLPDKRKNTLGHAGLPRQ
jgi:hypothetical protein